MRRKYGSEEARQRFPTLLAEAHQGKIAIITRHGRDYAALVPIQRLQEPQRRVSLLALRGTGKRLWADRDSIASQRDEW